MRCVLIHSVTFDCVYLPELWQWAECQQCPWTREGVLWPEGSLWRAELWNIASWLPWLSPPGIPRLYTVELLTEKNHFLLPEAVNGKQTRGWSSPFSPEPFQGKFSGNDFSRASWRVMKYTAMRSQGLSLIGFLFWGPRSNVMPIIHHFSSLSVSYQQ